MRISSMTRCALIVLLLCGALTTQLMAAPTKAKDPGGLFEERLRAAERARTTPRVTVRPAPSPHRATARRPNAPRAQAQRPQTSTRPTTRRRRVTITPRRGTRGRLAARPPATTRALMQRKAGTRGTRNPRYTMKTRSSLRTGEVSYSVDPRDRTLSNVDPTGDVVLFATATGPVRYRWERQKQLTRKPLVLKGYLPQMLKVTAETSSPRGGTTRAESWVPVRANCITTVRFNLQ